MKILILTIIVLFIALFVIFLKKRKNKPVQEVSEIDQFLEDMKKYHLWSIKGTYINGYGNEENIDLVKMMIEDEDRYLESSTSFDNISHFFVKIYPTLSESKKAILTRHIILFSDIAKDYVEDIRRVIFDSEEPNDDSYYEQVSSKSIEFVKQIYKIAYPEYSVEIDSFSDYDCEIFKRPDKLIEQIKMENDLSSLNKIIK